MSMVQAIDISANMLTGEIPSSVGSCKVLHYFNLSCNTLEGPIPVSLGELQNLEDADFSSNSLSGGIPTSLENLKMLRHLNFSFNNLSGEVPKGGVFKKLGSTAFIGNLGLCGIWVCLPPCSASKHKSRSLQERVIMPVLAVTAILVLSLFFVILRRSQNRKKHILKVGTQVFQMESSSQKEVYLMRPTC